MRFSNGVLILSTFSQCSVLNPARVGIRGKNLILFLLAFTMQTEKETLSGEREKKRNKTRTTIKRIKINKSQPCHNFIRLCIVPQIAQN